MAELPELAILQRQMHEALAGRWIATAEIRQPKCLNVTPDTLLAGLVNRRITAVSRRGKWLFLHLEPPLFLLLNPGMGADIWHYDKGGEVPAKYQFRLGLDDGSGFTCRFWWFGRIHLLSPDELPGHRETAGLGPSPLEIAAPEFIAMARSSPRATAKGFLLDQSMISGIGNAYAHDILWEARLHPLVRLGNLSEDRLRLFFQAIRGVLTRGIERGGVERDFYRTGGNEGDWENFFLVGYKEGRPCPRCGAPIGAIKTGATKTYICGDCQRL